MHLSKKSSVIRKFSMSRSSLKTFFSNFFLPNKNALQYYSIYFTFWREIVFEKQQRNIRLIKGITAVCLYQAVKYVLIELFNSSSSSSSSIVPRIVLYDCITLAIPSSSSSFEAFRQLNLMIAAISLMTAWLMSLSYLKGEPDAYRVLEDMLLRRQVLTFVWRRHRGVHASRYLLNFANKLLAVGPVGALLICKKSFLVLSESEIIIVFFIVFFIRSISRLLSP